MGKANIAGRNSSSTSCCLCAFLADLRRAQGKSGLRSPGSMPRSPDMMSYPSGTRPHRGGPSLRSAGSRSLPITPKSRIAAPRLHDNSMRHHPGRTWSRSGNMRHHPGSTWSRSGNMRHHPGRTWSRSGNMRHHPGSTWSRSGNMRHHPGRTWSRSGNMRPCPGKTRSHIGKTRSYFGSPGHRCPVLTRCCVMT